MEIVLIAAVDRNLAIGKDGKIPWNIKEDLNFFRRKTENNAIIMGRATFDSIGRPLPKRKNIVMTRSPQNREGIYEVSTAEAALEEAKPYSKVINIIGGENIYKEFLPQASKLIITEIDIKIEKPDAYFPEWDKNAWKEISRVNSSEDGIAFSFVEYSRN